MSPATATLMTPSAQSGQSVTVVRLVRVGYWRGETSPHQPDPTDFIDPEWDDDDRLQVAAYLQAGTIPWVGAGHSTCRICGLPNGSAEFTDGVFLWPAGLAHHVEEHRVRLPEPVLVHIRKRLDELLDDVEVDDEWWQEGLRVSHVRRIGHDETVGVAD